MVRTIWYMYKPGDDRDFAMTKPPSEAWVKKQEEDGFVIVSLDLELPDPATTKLGLVASIVEVGDSVRVTLPHGILPGTRVVP